MWGKGHWIWECLPFIKDLGLKEPYSGQTHLVSGEIAEDLTYYFATSEQIPTSVALGVLMNKDNTVRQAGGFIIQMMPFAEEEVIAALEDRLKDFSSVTTHLDAGETPEDMMKKLFEGFDMEVEDRIPTQFYCNCSKERVSKAVISVGKKDLQEMIDEGKPIEVNCHFCNSPLHIYCGRNERNVEGCKINFAASKDYSSSLSIVELDRNITAGAPWKTPLQVFLL